MYTAKGKLDLNSMLQQYQPLIDRLIESGPPVPPAGGG